MKRILKVLAVVMVLALTMATTAITAFAAPYTSAEGENKEAFFNKYLITEVGATTPNITFTYTIAAINAEDAIAATATTPAVLPGVGTPTIGSAAFTSADAPSTAEDAGVKLDEGEQYTKKGVNVDFSGVSFNEPGVYRYVITENETTGAKAVSYDTQTKGTARTRYLDVYVTDNGTDTLVVSSYVMHEKADVVALTADKASDKSSGFVNEIATKDLTFGKEVTGNQGSRDKYFKFTLSISNAQASTTYAVDISSAEAAPTASAATNTEYTSMVNAASITTDTSGAATYVCYLKDGQYITVKGLPAGYGYTLEEVEEDYTSTAGITADNNANNTAYADGVEGENVQADVKTGFTNDRSGVIPTGVIMTIAPFAIGLCLFAAVIIFVVNKRRRAAY